MKHIGEFIGITVLLLAAAGWVLNIAAIINSSFDPLTGLLVMRVIGVFVVPVGMILGWF